MLSLPPLLAFRGSLLAAACAVLAAGCHLPVVPQEPADPPAPGAVTQRVLLRIDSPIDGAVLVKRGEGGGVVCEAPCLREVDVEEGAYYVLHAPEQLPTEGFPLYSPEDPEVWLVHEPTNAHVPWVLGGVAAGSGGLGLSFMITGAVLGSRQGPRSDAEQTALTTLGVGGLVLGLVVPLTMLTLSIGYETSAHTLLDPALPGFRW